jgi:hypothetical protein
MHYKNLVLLYLSFYYSDSTHSNDLFVGKSTREPKGEGVADTKNTKPIWPECFLKQQ